MSESPVAALVRAWVRLYTSGLPAPLRDARRDEVDDDLWCEHQEAAALGRSARSLGGDLVLRLLFGIPADISWRLTHRGGAAPLHRERRSSTTRLGALAIAAGLCYGILLILWIPFSDALWTGDFGLVGMVVTLAGVIAFAASAVGIVLRFQDRVSPFGAVGALLVTVGAVMSMGGSLALLPIGSAMLIWDLSRVGMLSRRVAIAHLASAILILGALVFWPADLGQASGRALDTILIAPYLITWVAMGVSLIRGVPGPEAADG